MLNNVTIQESKESNEQQDTIKTKKVVECANVSNYKTIKYVRSFTLEYPNAISLNMEYYNNENYNNIRRCKLILLSHCLGDNNYFNCKSLKKEYLIKHLEKGCLNRSIKKAKEYDIRCIWDNEKFINIYHSVCYKVACNIDKSSIIDSDYIFNKIMNNDVNLMEVANMSSKQLCPEKYIKIDEKVNLRNAVETKVKYSEMYTCRKCKQNRTICERVYARSWDEGICIKVTCVYCSHSWSG
jgi:DNA-directed RNA polymerase subunit M/transcription elongation factor TFIIS